MHVINVGIIVYGEWYLTVALPFSSLPATPYLGRCLVYTPWSLENGSLTSVTAWSKYDCGSFSFTSDFPVFHGAVS